MTEEREIVGTGRHLSSVELRLWTSLLDTSRILDTELEADLVENHAMTHREYEVLVRLDGWGGELRMSDLAKQIEASAPLVTQTVRRLESRGLVERRKAADDGRGVVAVLTDDGSDALAAASEPHAAIVRALLTGPLAGSLEPLAGAIGQVADHLRGHRAGTSCGDPSCPLSRTGGAIPD